MIYSFFVLDRQREAEVIAGILELFSNATGMEINLEKSTLSTHLLGDDEIQLFSGIFPYKLEVFENGLKYLGFVLKPNSYQKKDWLWLIQKMEKHLNIWCHKWISKASILVMVKSILEAIPVYWMTLAWIPKGTLEAIRKLCFHFLWSGKPNAYVRPWVRWERIALPKRLGGWGIKNIFLFAKALALKGDGESSKQKAYGRRLSFRNI